MGIFDEPNTGLPILETVTCELLLLGYVILQMAQRKKWDPERIKTAIEVIRNNEMGSYKASRIFNVTQTTRYVKDRQKSSSETVKTKFGTKQVLPCKVETDLAEHCFLMEKKVFWLDNGRRHASRLPTCCKKRNKNLFCERNEKTERK
jgi:hypothetical protein